MNTVKEHLYLAALLHDIGKFYQRADTGSVANSKYLKPVITELRDILLPSYNGIHSHKHCLWTAQFIEDYNSVFQQLTINKLTDLTNKDNLINLSAGHHLPFEQQTELGKILKKADCLSSGMDRDNADSFKDDQDETGWESFKRKKMTSILQDIKNTKVGNRYHLSLSSVRLDKDYFPNKADEIPDYSSLWADFKKEFNLIQANTYHAFAETLLSLLFKYTATIPASTINYPDVSLYDHLKTTAGIAICLYDYQQEKQPLSENPFLLIGGDLSGIQNYIYQVISKYAAKNLKGRSFYLRILSDAIVRYLLRELHLFQANVIYNSGGSFYILAPNTLETKKKLQDSIAVIEAHLFKSHGTSLFVAIDSVEVSEDCLMHRNEQSLRKVWKTLFEKRDARKQTKFASLIKEDYNNFFMPIEGERLHDSITGEEFAKEELSHTKELDEEGKELQLREITYRQILFGKKLRESDLMIVSEEEIPYWKDKAFIAPATLNFYYYLLKVSDIEKMKEQLRASADKVSIVSLNGGRSLDCDFMRNIDGLNNIYSLEFYGGNLYSGKTFDEMCQSDSFSRLGVLRMDVDNLGSLFQSGIAESRATLSRYAALSRSLDYFFSGYLNKIQQEIDAENMFIIYSGGDDVFIVGRWDKTIDVAERIRSDFKAYTCDNPAFSISGGIAILGGKFPIMKGAEESDKEEKNAKNHCCGVCEKNSLSFMNTPLNWDKEYPAVKQLMEKIKSLTDQGRLPKSFISKILAHAMNAKIERHKITVVKVFWMLTYDFSRMKNAIKESECKELINNCILEVCGNKKTLNGNSIDTDYHSLELWAFASRWAELEIRTNN